MGFGCRTAGELKCRRLHVKMASKTNVYHRTLCGRNIVPVTAPRLRKRELTTVAFSAHCHRHRVSCNSRKKKPQKTTATPGRASREAQLTSANGLLHFFLFVIG
ncbi:hypothetical protein TRVL_07966 [Trypanosoma vivax]|nr:hypothetical protein TRVL_07966 [Trypanosoma vivax]